MTVLNAVDQFYEIFLASSDEVSAKIRTWELNDDLAGIRFAFFDS